MREKGMRLESDPESDPIRESKSRPPTLPIPTLLQTHEILIVLVFFILGFFLYANTLESPITFDGKDAIANNPLVQWTEISWDGTKRLLFENSGLKSHRPLPYISFALNYYFDQYNVAGYHIVNIIIHIITGILLYYFGRITLNISKLNGKHDPLSLIPLFAALIWLAFPVQTQSVTYIYQRTNSMAAMFYLLSLLLYAKGRLSGGGGKKWGLFIGAALAGILALGSKEIAATLPFFLFLYEWYFFRNLSRAWLKRCLPYLAGILFVFIVVAVLYLGIDPIQKIMAGYGPRDFTLTERVLTQFRVVVHYMTLIFFPHPSRLNLDHDFAISHSLLDPISTITSLGIILALIALAIYLGKRAPLISFCLLWFFGNLVIESSVMGLEIIFEHRTYLPSMLVFLMLVTLAFRYLRSKWLSVGLMCAVLIIFSAWTYQRNRVWGDNITLWQDCVNKSPKKARPHANLGDALVARGRLDEAIDRYSEALLQKSGHRFLYKVHNNLGVALFKKGKIEEAMVHYRETLRAKPDYAPAQYNLGDALVAQEKLGEAITHYSLALRLDPGLVAAHNNLGIALFKRGKIGEAIAHFREALRIKPDHSYAYKNLQVALAKQESGREAFSKNQEARKTMQKDLDAHHKLGNLFKTKGKLDNAIKEYQEALSINPEFAPALNNLALVYVDKGEYDKALSLYMKIIDLHPDYYPAYYNMACMYAIQNKVEESIFWLKKAVKKGFKDWDFLKTDKDLENIRGTSYFKELTNGE
jgi:tetratricopeptide (TPR) repeat protein